MESLTVFSDGGCIGNPGPGGWAAILVRGSFYEELGASTPHTTNNRMEMTGAMEGLRRSRPGEQVRIITDSRYLIDGATKWIWGWKKRGWTRSDGEPVLNRDLWEEIDSLASARKVVWEHVPGHSGHPENERCDRIANGFARGESVELLSGDGAWIFKDPPKSYDPDEKYTKPIYLSIVDGDIREHGSWTQCEARIKGIKGSRCKKVVSKAEHIAALTAWKDIV